MLAALVGAAAGHAVAHLFNPAASPVVAVGAVVIDATPTPVKEWATSTLGTADKAVLVAGVILFVALFGALAGWLAPRRRSLAIGLVAVLGVISGAAALSRPEAGPLDVLPALVATLLGRWLLFAFPGWVLGGDSRADDLARLANPQARRRFLIGGAGLAAAGGALALLGDRSLTGLGGTASSAVRLPVPDEQLPPLPAGLEGRFQGISPLRTPTADFYRIDIALAAPRVDHAGWTLRIDGLVDRPYSITFDELLAMPMIERDITLTCVSNPVGGDLCGSTRWLGVRVDELLRRAGPQQGADMVLSSAPDGFSASTPLEVLLDGRNAMIAVAMDGEPLTRIHGAPARLLTPGLYGYVGATKWLTRLEVTSFARSTAYWTDRGWSVLGPVKTACRIDTPRTSATAGETHIAGVAWATHRGIAKVEVSVDDGPWQEAELGPEVGVDYWRQWVLAWRAEQGQHRLVARATDGDGAVQSSEIRDVVPDGAEGYHVVDVLVE